MHFKNKVILITGANRGIGLALARTALDQGWDVIATVRASGKRNDLDLLATEYPQRLFIESLDVADSASVMALGKKLSSTPIEILVNNAGIIGPSAQSTLEMDFEGFKHTLDVNTLGPLRVSQALLPCLRAAQKRGGIAKIVTITSAMGRMSYAKSDHIAYRASKSALNKVMQGLATDLTGEGLAVLMLHPGWVRTDMGGAAADISAEVSAAGIFAQIVKADISKTGSFIDYQGETIPW